jgi:hypothetical protein
MVSPVTAPPGEDLCRHVPSRPRCRPVPLGGGGPRSGSGSCALSAVMRLQPGRRAYQRARDRRQPHNRALRGIGARWVRILWRCWTDGTIYDPGMHLKTSPWRSRPDTSSPARPRQQHAAGDCRLPSHQQPSRPPRHQRLTAGVCIIHYPDTAVMSIPGGPVLAGGGDRARVSA